MANLVVHYVYKPSGLNGIHIKLINQRKKHGHQIITQSLCV